ncbi:unnamed protein product [Arabis nemorensis]|uniref:Uncharacterized protein n=1 Tax=Arabis nemorensis TaxID=586526 RepID=A0A565BJ59_9BRAS|nr:unnamed protein product [Arabis nemorensis]
MAELRRVCLISPSNTLPVVNLLELQEGLEPQVPPEPPDPSDLPLTPSLASYRCYSLLSPVDLSLGVAISELLQKNQIHPPLWETYLKRRSDEAQTTLRRD